MLSRIAISLVRHRGNIPLCCMATASFRMYRRPAATRRAGSTQHVGDAPSSATTRGCSNVPIKPIELSTTVSAAFAGCVLGYCTTPAIDQSHPAPAQPFRHRLNNCCLHSPVGAVGVAMRGAVAVRPRKSINRVRLGRCNIK
jgi:hypothetical protein